MLGRIEPYVGRSLADLAAVVGRADREGKAASAQTVRALVGEHGKGRSGEFERFGIEMKIVPVNSSGSPVEAMSSCIRSRGAGLRDLGGLRPAGSAQADAHRSRSTESARHRGGDAPRSPFLLDSDPAELDGMRSSSGRDSAR